MKVAHVLSHVSAEHAGVPIATRKMAQTLRRAGVEVSFWTTGNDHDAQELLDEGIPSRVFDRSWPRGWRYAPGLSKALIVASRDIELMHIHEVWNYPQLAAARVAKKTGTPCLWAPHASLEPWRMRYKAWKKKCYFSIFGTYMMEHVACMHAVAAREVEGFRRLGYCGPVAVVPNGISIDEFRTMPDPARADQIWPALAGRRVMLFLSRLSPEKGLDQLLPAWADIVKLPSHADALLVLAGPDDRGYRQALLEMIDSLGLTDRVLLAGMIKGNDKLALISRANMYVLPSYSEGFSNSLLENLAAGKPALITPGCNFPEAVAAGAAVCVEPQRGAIAEGLKAMLNMPADDLMNMGRKGRELVMGSYTWDVAARRLITVYHAILKGKEIPFYPEPVALDTRGKAVFP